MPESRCLKCHASSRSSIRALWRVRFPLDWPRLLRRQCTERIYMFKTKSFSTSVIKKDPILQESPRFPSGQFISLDEYRPEILAEDVFRRILCWERKRAERSGRRFLLMLANVESVLEANRRATTLSEIASALYRSTRETDIAGWYREGAIVGVIFTEIHQTDRSTLESLICAKVTGALRTKVDAKEVDRIHLSFHFFPEESDQT